MPKTIIPAILSGGAGTRLWPMSTQMMPKQFHPVLGARSLFQETVLRLRGEIAPDLGFAAPIILAGAEHEALVRAQLADIEIDPALIILEPEGRNTAAAAALAAAAAQSLDPEALLLLAPADHLVADAPAFHAAIARAAATAVERIVTFGITPTHAETGYGYIQAGGERADGIAAIQAFHEKPGREAAEAYLRQTGFYWNAGLFLVRPAVLQQEFTQHAPDIFAAASQAFAQAPKTGPAIHLSEAFRAVRAAPFDVAIMEHTKNGAICPCNIGWADVGSWSELWRLAEKDGAGNALAGEVTTLEASRNLVRACGPRVAIAGVNDLIVVATAESVLIVPMSRAQDVRRLALQQLAAS